VFFNMESFVMAETVTKIPVKIQEKAANFRLS
jgi:hypothetical protein